MLVWSAKTVFPLKKARIYCIFLLGLSALHAQQIPGKGVPWLDNYAPAQYLNHGKIWDIASADNGLVYLAGDGGLLEYDGRNWRAFRGSKGYTRSLWVAADSLIYTGSDLDFGVWKRNARGQFDYSSLYPFGEGANEENEEFWGVHSLNGQPIFASFSNLYLYKNNQFTKIAAPSRFSGSFQTGGTLYLADEEKGLYAFNGMSLKLVVGYPGNRPFRVVGVHALPGGQLLIVTKDSGLFVYQNGVLKPWPTEVSAYLGKDQLFCFTAISNTHLAFGSILNGLYVTDLQGRVVQHLNKRKGLPNNTVLSMHYAPNGLLWLGMDYGLSAVQLYNNLTYFFDDQGEFGTAHTSLLKDGTFYLGSNQGLYAANWAQLDNGVNPGVFSLVPGSEGQVWSLVELDGKLYCGHDKGLLAVSGGRLQPIHPEPGVWTFLPYGDNYLLTGHYNGISVFKKQGEGYVFHKKIDLILGSCNQLLAEKDNLLWVNIPNYGLIRFRLNADFYPEERKIFPLSLFAGNAPRLLKGAAGIQLITSAYRYVFDPLKNEFIRQEAYSPPVAVAGLLTETQQPIALSEQYLFYAIYNGFALQDASIVPPAGSQGHYPVLVRQITAFNNHRRQAQTPGVAVEYGLNNLRFDFVAPHQPQARYQYQLLNHSEGWSEWSAEPSATFLNLKEGNYTLQLRAGSQGQITSTVDISFTVLPPWYRSWPAYLAYALLLAWLYYLNRRNQNAHLRKQKEALQEQEQRALQAQAEQYKQQVMLAKQQHLEYEKELLSQQIKQKSIELAKQAKENEDKNRLLHIMKEKMDEVQPNTAVSKTHWNELKRLLDLYLETDNHAFEIQIDELHQAFFKAMRERFPDLSLYDLRLCAYLKMGLNSKEISEMLQVLPSSINVSRSRLRKKLSLLPDEDLYTFLNGMG